MKHTETHTQKSLNAITPSIIFEFPIGSAYALSFGKLIYIWQKIVSYDRDTWSSHIFR